MDAEGPESGRGLVDDLEVRGPEGLGLGRQERCPGERHDAEGQSDETPSAVVIEGEQDRDEDHSPRLGRPGEAEGDGRENATATRHRHQARDRGRQGDAVVEVRCPHRDITPEQDEEDAASRGRAPRRSGIGQRPEAADEATQRHGAPDPDRRQHGHGHQRTGRRQRNGDHDAQGSELELRVSGVEMESPGAGPASDQETGGLIEPVPRRGMPVGELDGEHGGGRRDEGAERQQLAAASGQGSGRVIQ